MKRRTFLSTTGTIGITGAVSGSALAASTFNSLSAHTALQSFDQAQINVLDQFILNVEQNLKELDLDPTLAKKITLPHRIINQDKTSVSYLNQSKNHITILKKNDQYFVKVGTA